MPRFSLMQQEAIENRWELILTLAMDGAMLLAAILTRAIILWVLARVTPDGTENWAIFLTSTIVDFGFVTTALVITAVDLINRVKTAWHSLVGGDP